jgi:putative transposase
VLLQGCRNRPRLRKVWADGGYAGKLVEWVKEKIGCILEIVKRPDKQQGFQVLPRRWIVERTFGWLEGARRLSKDFELCPKSSESMVYLTMLQKMLRRLAA